MNKTVIVHDGSLDAQAAAVVVKSNATGDVVLHEVKAGEPFPRAALVADQIWILELDYGYSDLPDDGIVVLCDKTGGIPIERSQLHVILSDEGIEHKREMCARCSGTGGKFPRGRSVGVATWLALKQVCSHCGGECEVYEDTYDDGSATLCFHCDGKGDEPIPAPLLTIEDDVMGYGNIPDSKAICLGLSLALHDCDADERIDVMLAYVEDEHDEWEKKYKPFLRQNGFAALDYQRYLAARFGPMLKALGDGRLCKDELDKGYSLNALMAELGIERGEGE